MKKSLIIILVLVTISTYLLVKAKTTLLEPKVSRSALFAKGSEKQIRKFLETLDHQITITDYYYLIGRDRTDILEIILKEYGHTANYPGYKSGSPLTYAAKELKRQAVELLVKYGADVNYVDDYGNTALIYATKATASMRSFKYSSQEITKTLIDAGADVNAVGKWFTPLGAAMYSKDMVNAKYIVDHGADVKFKSRSGLNYLSSCFSIECLEYFLEKGLDINRADNKGKSLLHSSVLIPSDDITKVKKLIEWGVDLCHLDNEGYNVLRHAEEGDLNPHLHKDNPEFYQKKLTEHRDTEVYKYLEKEYNKKCLKIN